MIFYHLHSKSLISLSLAEVLKLALVVNWDNGMSDKVQYTHINFSSIPSCCTPLGAASKWYLSAVTVAELLS